MPKQLPSQKRSANSDVGHDIPCQNPPFELGRAVRNQVEATLSADPADKNEYERVPGSYAFTD